MRRPFSPLSGTCFALALLVVPACGGDDDGVSIVDGGGGGAGADGGGGAGGGVLGQRCDANTGCPDNMPICLSVGQNATEGFCSKGFATTPAADGGGAPMLPPQDSHATCQQGYTGEGTPACAAPLAAMNGVIPWVCVLACGSTPTDEYGACPSNLTCDQPEPSVNGFCFPPG